MKKRYRFPYIDAWLVREKEGKMRRAIFFCGKDYVPAKDCCEVIKVKVSFVVMKEGSKNGN